MAVYEGKLVGKTVQLRSLEERDAEVTYKMRIDPNKTKYLNTPPASVEAQRLYIQNQRLKPDDYYFLIEDLEGNPIGMRALADYDPEKKIVESGRFIGFGTQIQHMEALQMGFDFAFDVLGVSEIYMTVIANNTSMHSIQLKMGAKEVKRVYMPEFGCDSIHSILKKEDWINSRKKVVTLVERFAGR